MEGFNDTVYVQSGEPIGVKDGDLCFANLLEHEQIKSTTVQGVA